MTPAAPRSMPRPASRAQICTAALWDNCRCPRCRPAEHTDTPSHADAGIGPPASAAGVPSPFVDAGTPSHPGDALFACQTSPVPAADVAGPQTGAVGGPSSSASRSAPQ